MTYLSHSKETTIINIDSCVMGVYAMDGDIGGIQLSTPFDAIGNMDGPWTPTLKSGFIQGKYTFSPQPPCT